MQYLRFSCWTLFCFGLFYLLNFSRDIGSNNIPSLGKLLNPTSGIWNNAEKSTDLKDRKLKIEGPENTIEIIFDDRMVPHIFAASVDDALFAQGYVEASMRLWQMDFIQRAAGGRLAEVVGEKALKRDIMQRKQGMLLAAEKAVHTWEQFSEEGKGINSYIDGVNTFINNLKPKDYPIEFKLLGYKPEVWTSLHSALVLKSMTATLASYNEDIPATNTLNYLGEELFELLFPNRDPYQSPVIPNSVDYSYAGHFKVDTTRGSTYDKKLPDDLSIFTGMRGVGSNNWAVHPQKSESSNTLLCNDPHLNLTLPSIWYELHIVTPECNAYGVSIPGMPGIMIGFNDHIAWGNTNVGHDFTDYYAIDWVDFKQKEYFVGDQRVAVDIRKEKILIKGGYSYEFDLRLTEFGPVYTESKSDSKLSLARDWIGNKSHNLDETNVFIDIMKAKNYQDYRKASDQFFAPAQNFLFADKQNIALRVNGNLPLKSHNEGRFVKMMHDQNLNADQYIPRNENPEAVNPARGFLSSANQVSTDASYPYYYNGSFEEYRGIRVNSMLSQKDALDLEDMKAIQRDVYSLKAEKFLPKMLAGIQDTALAERYGAVIDSLNSWDYRYTSNSVSSKYFHDWFQNFKSAYWKDLYDSSYSERILYPEDFILYELVALDEKKIAEKLGFDTLKLKKNLLQSLKKTVQSYSEEQLGQSWGQYRPKNINHMLQIPAFSYTNLQLGGCGDVINAISSGLGPSWRMIVELGDNTTALVVLPGGQSGDPGSKFYDDSMQKWIEGDYHKIDLSRSKEDIIEQKLCSLTLEIK